MRRRRGRSTVPGSGKSAAAVGIDLLNGPQFLGVHGAKCSPEIIRAIGEPLQDVEVDIAPLMQFVQRR